MKVSRPLSVACALLTLIAVHLSGQQRQPVPAVPAQQEPATAQRGMKGDIDHGRYLVERVLMCAECHSTRDPQGNIIASGRFMGGPIPFRPPWASDWATQAPRNAGLPGYTEDLGIRLLTQGAIDREGRQLRAPMPRYRMTPKDALDVVTYLKSIG